MLDNGQIDRTTNAEDTRDTASIPGLGQPPGGGNGNPLQYSCLKNPINRGAWWATIHGVTKEPVMTQQLSTHDRQMIQMADTHTHIYINKSTYHLLICYLSKLILILKQEIYFKELTHPIMGADQHEIHMGKLAT